MSGTRINLTTKDDPCRIAAWRKNNLITQKTFIQKFQLNRLSDDVQEIKKHLGISE